MDIRILSVMISASVGIFVAVLNHFIISPIKEKRNRKREQLKNLYAPLYSLICLRIFLVKDLSLSSKKLQLGNVKGIDYHSRSYMEQFILDRSGYCLTELTNAWINYSSQFGNFKKEYTEELVVATVKGYNQLKKELKMSYNKEELRTGIPDVINEYRMVME